MFKTGGKICIPKPHESSSWIYIDKSEEHARGNYQNNWISLWVLKSDRFWAVMQTKAPSLHKTGMHDAS